MDLSMVGRQSTPYEFSYTESDVILYALGVGAQTDELEFVYEGVPGGLQVIPSFSVLAPGGSIVEVLGPDIDFPRLLHGEQTIRMHRPIPPSGTIVTVGTLSSIFDKGKAAVINIKNESTLPDGEPLFETEAALFYLGEGGFGGPRGPKIEKIEPPEGVAPDFSVSYEIAENQAAIYRLSGDINPLHIDPKVAQRVGFDKPILHGLSTYGFATRAIVHGLCGGDVKRFRAFSVRLSNVVFPGDTVTTEGWKQGGGRYIIQVRTERDVAMTNAWAEVDE
jgi:acyl dehydratase